LKCLHSAEVFKRKKGPERMAEYFQSSVNACVLNTMLIDKTRQTEFCPFRFHFTMIPIPTDYNEEKDD
jgi:hypothetical protein